MRLGPEGLFLTQRQEGLTPQTFEELIQRKEPFTLKVDYRGLPPPLEELDLVTLTPARASGLPPGTLVLRRVLDWLEFSRLVSSNHVARKDDQNVARVVRVERPGALIRLDSIRWRLLDYLLVTLPGFQQAFERWRQLRSFVGRLLHPFPCPLSLGPPESLVEGVIRKYSHPDEVAYQARLSREGLEDWEERLFSRHLHPPARLLVVSCGAGREALALAKQGFRVVGVDHAPELIAVARGEAETQKLDVTFEVMACRELRYPAASFDAALCLPAIYQHTPMSRRRIELLRAIGCVLIPQGILVLCAGWYSDVGPRLALVEGLRRLLRRLLGERFPTEPGDRLIRHLSFASDANVRCFCHVFQSPEEIHQEVVAAGWFAERDSEGPWILRKSA